MGMEFLDVEALFNQTLFRWVEQPRKISRRSRHRPGRSSRPKQAGAFAFLLRSCEAAGLRSGAICFFAEPPPPPGEPTAAPTKYLIDPKFSVRQPMAVYRADAYFFRKIRFAAASSDRQLEQREWPPRWH